MGEKYGEEARFIHSPSTDFHLSLLQIISDYNVVNRSNNKYKEVYRDIRSVTFAAGSCELSELRCRPKGTATAETIQLLTGNIDRNGKEGP